MIGDDYDHDHGSDGDMTITVKVSKCVDFDCQFLSLIGFIRRHHLQFH